MTSSSPATAHPRSRGENRRERQTRSNCAGSSPLTRGKHVEVGHGPEGHGLIPAHAGKTSLLRTYLMCNRAHPRSRGENFLSPAWPTSGPGSSPLTRGKRSPPPDTHSAAGLIPAHAGKTTSTATNAGRAWAHPRSRGENQHLSPTTSSKPGSSPLTRGKRERC